MKFFVYVVRQLCDFHLAEMEALCDLHGVEFNAKPLGGGVLGVMGKEIWPGGRKKHAESIFYEIELPSVEVAKAMASRAILWRGVFELWGHGKTYEECLQQSIEYKSEMKEKSTAEDTSFRFEVHAFGRNYGLDEQVERINRFSQLGFKGKVDLKKAEHTFWVIEDIGLPDDRTLAHTGRGMKLQHVFLARLISPGRRDLSYKYTLKQRKYCGPTSMDAELAFLMANQALVRSGSYVCDPYVGTASVLVGCTVFGALCVGSDLNMVILKGRSWKKKKEKKMQKGQKVKEGGRGANIRSNFQQYGLDSVRPDLVCCDIAHTCYRKGMQLDAIVCDPPYGIRAGSRVVGRKGGDAGEADDNVDDEPFPELHSVGEENEECPPSATCDRSTAEAQTVCGEGEGDSGPAPEGTWQSPHFPQMKKYSVPDSIRTLVAFALEQLRVGGRLVFWMPTKPENVESDLPEHPCMRLVSDSVQPLTMRWGRRLITMEKTSEDIDGADVAYPEKPSFEDFKAHVFAPSGREKVSGTLHPGKKNNKTL
eukprot:Rmarinus@m.7277